MAMLAEPLGLVESGSWVPLGFSRPADGPLAPEVELPYVSGSGLGGWQSHGGPSKSHPCRALPRSVEIGVPPGTYRVHLMGVFALYARRESAGAVGACIQFLGEDGPLARVDLRYGVHYRDSADLSGEDRAHGDGTSTRCLGETKLDGGPARLDLLSIDVPANEGLRSLCFRDLGEDSSFVLFDVFAEFHEARGCPFHSRSGGVALGELGSILRVGDRARFARAIEQLEEAVHHAEDLDEARGQALTFLAVVTAASLEAGGGRSMHRVQLEAAREMEQAVSAERVAAVAKHWLEQVAPGMLVEPESPSAALMHRAMAIVERNFAKRLTDAEVARRLGLSTSHFRYLFRQATGQPFHRYVIAVRLEKARRMLMEEDAPVSQVASAVGFAGISHFSRAFTQRFSVSPTEARRASPV